MGHAERDGIESTYLKLSTVADVVVHICKSTLLCYTCSLVCSDPLKRHGASYKLFFVVDIFSVRKCPLKV